MQSPINFLFFYTSLRPFRSVENMLESLLVISEALDALPWVTEIILVASLSMTKLYAFKW